MGERGVAFTVRQAMPFDRVRSDEVILTEAWAHSFTTDRDQEFDQIVIGVEGPKEMSVNKLEVLTGNLVSVHCN